MILIFLAVINSRGSHCLKYYQGDSLSLLHFWRTSVSKYVLFWNLP